MAFQGQNYAPPNVYTRTFFENPVSGAIESFKIPILIGEGNEYLSQSNLEVVRGSSQVIDQKITGEDAAGRAVVSVTQAGVVTLGNFDGVLTKIQVRKFPITDGQGSGTVTNSRNDVLVTINNQVAVVQTVNGSTGIIQIAQAPLATDTVRVTYYFKRTDTLITDNVSAQVDPNPAVVRAVSGIGDANSPVGQEGSIGAAATLDLHGDIKNSYGQVIVPANNVLNIVVDGVLRTITIPARSDYTIAQIAAAITAAGAGTLTASSFINNFGVSALQLNASGSIVVNAGSANSLLGILTGAADTRTTTFYTFQGPIVDGSNGGVTTTDTSKVTVKVNGIQVIPTSLNGAQRAVTLPSAPKAGSTVTIQYWFNAWQDTFDYLAHTNVTEITQCGVAPGSKSYIQDSDFILKDDKVVWGTAALISSGVYTQGSTMFGENQITATLIDNRTFLDPCTPVVQSSGGVSVDSRLDFQLPLSPTLGNGRDTPLGQSLFQTVSNGRIDLPVNRPDVVLAYWGYDVQDAMDRGPVTVDKVEGSVITLAEAVPVGATVFATYWYNELTDNEYTLTCVNPGASGVGTYSVTDKGLSTIYGPTFNTASKGASLNGIPVEFPSGSELSPDLRFESVSGNDFTGPIEEIVSVQFASRTATPAKWAFPGAGPYEFIKNYSDRLRIKLHSYESVGAAGLNLDNPSGSAALAGHGGGFFASLIGSEVNYTGGAGAIIGQSYTLTAAEEFYLQIDDANILAKTHAAQTAVDVSYFADVINEAASGHQATAVSGGLTSIELPHTKSDVDNYYVGWRVVIGNHALGGATPGQYRTITAYDAATWTATVDSAWTGGAVAALTPYNMYNPDARSTYAGATQFNGPVTILAGKHDTLKVAYVGDVVGAEGFEITLTPATYSTPALLAAEVQTQIDTAIAARVVATPALAGFNVECSANSNAQLRFRLQLAGLDSAGYIQFLNSTGSPAQDFAVLVGLDTAAATGGGQAALLQAPVARAYLCPTGTATKKLYDRLILRNRLLPGGGPSSSMDAHSVEAQTMLQVLTGNTKAGLVSGVYGTAARTATVRPATVTGRVGFVGGMDTDGEPLVTFYDGTGVVAANNVMSVEVDGVPISVTFDADSVGIATPLGPITDDDSILGQIKVAMAAVPGTPFGTAANIISTQVLRQEGAGFRLTGIQTTSNSKVVVNTGSANGVLGLSSGTISLRSTVSAYILASALMANRSSTFTTWLLSLSSSDLSFSQNGLAMVIEDSVNAEHLYIQDAPVLVSELGTQSSILIKNTSLDDALAYNTGLNAVDGDGATGEPALDGYFVTSSVPGGSGSINSSILNPSGDGTGQDGVVGQTYRDAVTGLTFTIMPRGWSTNPNGPWLTYPTGTNATFRIAVSSTFLTDANIPNNALNGVELVVANTYGVAGGDTALVETFERGGNEPSIGDLYYVSYVYQKQDFTTAFFTKMSAIELAYGTLSTDAPLTLASDMAILNGAVILGLKQVPRETGSPYASLVTYRNAIDELEGTLPGYINPDIITPLRGDSTELYQYLKQSNELMSSLRYKSERTSIIGVAAGTTPAQAGELVQALSQTRMRLVYPDAAVITITDALGNSQDQLMDGPMLAAMMIGSVVSPNFDVATPWTGRRLVGVRRLARTMDAVAMNQLAVKGVTILEDRPPFLRVRHGLTTDMTNTLTKLPTIIMIADEVQRQSRSMLENFIGVKFLPGVLSQVEGRLSMLLKNLVKAKIITAFTGVKATTVLDDPVMGEVTAFYSPVFPLLYLLLTFQMRTQI